MVLGMRFNNEREAREFLKNCRNNISNFTKSSAKFASSGFNLASKDVLEERQSICKKCDEWDSISFKGTGRCKKCGCSTWAKIRMATERCPLGKWQAVDKDKIIVEQYN
jgi:predicted Zn-ribbon and HTH transcriptional regulator